MLPLTIDELLDLYRQTKAIAVVGASNNERKQAYRVPKYLQTQGYKVIPVNLQGDEILGEPVVRTLLDITEQVDVVQVFRPPEEAPAIATDAAALGARVLWMQLGIVSEAARRIAERAGLTVVMDACMGAVHRKLRRRHGLGR